MPYAYQAGDYYRGDYYRGDPGIFGAIGKAVGGLVKGVARVAAPIIRTVAPIALPGIGGVIGGIAGTVLGGSRSTALVPASAGSLPPTPEVFTGIQVGGGRGITIGHRRTLTSGGEVYMDQNGQLVRKKGRRMNVANPKALRRALRRVSGFGKLARRARRDIGRAASAVGVRRGGAVKALKRAR